MEDRNRGKDQLVISLPGKAYADRIEGVQDWLPQSNGTASITSPFGAHEQWRKDMGLGPHPGTDLWFPAVDKAHILAPQRLQILVNGWDALGGNYLAMDLGSRGGIREVITCMHLAERPAWLPGQIAEKGQLLARANNTGSATTGAHMHWLRYTGPDNGDVRLADFAELFTGEVVRGYLPGEVEDHLQIPPSNLERWYKIITDAFIPAYVGEDDTTIESVAPDDGYAEQFIVRIRR